VTLHHNIIIIDVNICDDTHHLNAIFKMATSDQRSSCRRPGARRHRAGDPWCKVLHSHTQRAGLQTCIATTRNTQIHESTRGYIRGDYTNSDNRSPALQHHDLLS